MRHRLALAAAALGALALAMPSALAAPTPQTLDGKKVSKLTLNVDAPRQSNDASMGSDAATGYDRYQCEAPRCAVVPFIYKQAKGVKSDIAMELTWANPTSDFDLYLMQIDKTGRTKMLSCGGAAGTHEKIFIPAGTLKSGKTYAMMVDFYRTVGEKINAELTMPGTDTTAKTVPSAVNALQAINCTLGHPRPRPQGRCGNSTGNG